MIIDESKNGKFKNQILWIITSTKGEYWYFNLKAGKMQLEIIRYGKNFRIWEVGWYLKQSGTYITFWQNNFDRGWDGNASTFIGRKDTDLKR